MESLSLEEKPPENFDRIQINDRSGLKQDILRRYFCHLTADDFSTAREKLQQFGDLCQRREEAKEDPQYKELSILILGSLEEDSRSHLEAWIRRQEIPEGFHLHEICVAAGDIFIFTYRPREKQKSGQITRDKENRRCLSHFSSFPANLRHLPYPKTNLNGQLFPGRLVNVLFAGDKQTNAENFLKKAVVTYVQEELQRETGNKAEDLPYVVPLNGIRYQFNVTKKGDKSLAERISKEIKELPQLIVVGLLVDVDVEKQKEVVKALDTVKNMVLIGYSAKLSSEEITKKFMDFYGRKQDVAEEHDNLFCGNRKGKILDEKKVEAKVKVIEACLTAARNAPI